MPGSNYQKIRVGVLMGGPSVEHEISLASGRQVLACLDTNKYHSLAVKISKSGQWFLTGQKLSCEKVLKKIDLAFLALHGEFGEDGCLQSLLDFYRVPYTGSGRLASALGMDKLKSREVFNLAGLFTPKTWVPGGKVSKVRFPVVVKPRSRGSSVGVFIVHQARELKRAIYEARKFDHDVLVEEFLSGREVTCGVLENFRGQKYFALPVTEIRPKTAAFFDYQAKYIPGASEEITPALLSTALTKKVQAAAIRAHQLLGCRGYSRSDLIVKNRQPYLLEINTLPGLTKTSLLPQAVTVAGLTFSQLLDIIIDNSLK